MLNILQARLQQYMNFELPDIQAGFRKAEEPEVQLSTSVRSSKKQESSRKTSTSALSTTPKSLTVLNNKLWKILKEMGIPDHLTCLLRNRYVGQEGTIRAGLGTTDGSKSGKEYVKAVYCHPAYLTYVQSTSRLPE